MKQLLNTLFVTSSKSYIRAEGNTLCVESDGQQKLRIPLHHIGSVVCFGDVMMTPAAMHRCADGGRSIVLLDRNGRFKARLEGPVSGNILLRQAQHRLAGDTDFQLNLVRAFLLGKLKNSRQVLLRAARDSSDNRDSARLNQTSRLLATYVQKILLNSDIEVLRGFEGDAARSYFACFGNIVRKDRRSCFEMIGRSRRPPLDRMNALLSFLYSMLMNDCRSAVEAVGLDAQLGFLHAVRPGRAALSLDLMEELRPLLADRVALTLINLCQIGPEDFDERTGGAVTLNDRGKKTVLSAYQTRKQDEVFHQLLEQKVPMGLLPHVQARLLARTIRGDMDHYLPFVTR